MSRRNIRVPFGIEGLKEVLLLVSLTLVMGAIAACASKSVFGDSKTLRILWPMPPEQTRIELVDIIVDSNYVKKENIAGEGLLAFFLGEPKGHRFIKPAAIAVHGDVIYVADLGGVVVLDLGKKEFRTIGTEEVMLPTGVTTAPDGRVFVSEASEGFVHVFNGDGAELYVLGADQELETPSGVAYDPEEDLLYVVETKAHRISVFSGENLVRRFGRRGGALGEFNFPYNLTVAPDGRIFVVDTGNFRVQILAPDGTPMSSFGRPGDTPGTFARPKAVALDVEGHIYVLDAAFGNFQILDENGVPLLLVGEVGKLPGQFRLPTDIVAGAEDKFYVVDQINRRIQVFKYLRYDEQGNRIN